MLNYIEYLGLPTTIAVSIVVLFFVSQIIGEIIELFGKTVPVFFKVRKHFSQKKKEKNEISRTLREVRKLLDDVNQHYSADNIQKRDSWMKWVNDRAEVYDDSIVEIFKKIDDVVQALKQNTKMTEEMFVQNSRDRIIDFAAKAGNEESAVSREEFNRIFKVYNEYETFLEEHDRTNGEIDIAMRIIQESYEQHMKKHTFTEDVRGYNV